MKKNKIILALFAAVLFLILLSMEKVELTNSVYTIFLGVAIALICDLIKAYKNVLYKPSIIIGSLVLCQFALYEAGTDQDLTYIFYLIPIALGIMSYGVRGGIITYFTSILMYSTLFVQGAYSFTPYLNNALILGVSTLGFCYFDIKNAEISFKNERWLEKLHSKINELSLLREITNSMQTTTDLKKTNKIILTAITAGYGLGFNRALMFMVDGEIIRGETAIGPPSRKEAYKIWGKLVRSQTSLNEVIAVDEEIDETLSEFVRKVKLNIRKDKGNPIIECLNTKKPLNIKNADKRILGEDLAKLDFENYVIVPLISKNQSVGVLLVDNRYNEKTISQEDVDSLVTFANQSSLAIENIRLYEQVSNLAITDGLTSLYNHRYFKEQLSSHIEKKENFCLLVIDIDDFKQFNEQYGHSYGDKVLSEVGKILQLVAGTNGIASRYGGDEFTIILPDYSKEVAKDVALSIQEYVEGITIGSKGIVRSPVTLSIGLAAYPEDSGDAQGLFKKADEKLRDSKISGKNTVT